MWKSAGEGVERQPSLWAAGRREWRGERPAAALRMPTQGTPFIFAGRRRGLNQSGPRFMTHDQGQAPTGTSTLFGCPHGEAPPPSPEGDLKGGRPANIWYSTQPSAHRSAAQLTEQLFRICWGGGQGARSGGWPRMAGSCNEAAEAGQPGSAAHRKALTGVQGNLAHSSLLAIHSLLCPQGTPAACWRRLGRRARSQGHPLPPRLLLPPRRHHSQGCLHCQRPAQPRPVAALLAVPPLALR